MSVLELNDKPAWCEVGLAYEEQFVRLMSWFPGSEIRVNPDKAENPYLPDLLDGATLADLKTQTTPFFTAARYGLDPAFTVSYNRKDYERYGELYPDLRLYFWARWSESIGYGVRVAPLYAVRSTTADTIAAWVASGEVREHTYVGRTDDRAGNARSSFLLDIRWMDEVITYGGRS